MVFGSQLYGTSTPTSDTDIKAVHMETLDRFLLNKKRDVISLTPSKVVGQKNTVGDTDYESFELNRFVSLAAEGQTVAFDMLFAPKSYWTEYTPEWERLVQSRDLFVTKQPQKFVGYCRAQANKYGIKGERMAAAKEASEFFDSLITINGGKDRLRDHNDVIVRWILEKAQTNEFIKLQVYHAESEPMVDICDRKCQWGNTLLSAFEMYNNLYNEYGERARAAMSSDGKDWKALSHAVRIAQEAVELLTTGEVTFPRPNAAFLLEIKKGNRPYTEVSELVDSLLTTIEQLSANSKLPEKVDQEKVNNLVLQMYYPYVLEQLTN